MHVTFKNVQLNLLFHDCISFLFNKTRYNTFFWISAKSFLDLSMIFSPHPENLLLTADHKTVKLADFGLAREESLTEMMTAETGTYRWMAPEVI